MTMWLAVLCGGLGGSVRGVLALYRGVAAWVHDRRETHQRHPGGPRPRFFDAADWSAELVGMSAQIVIGCLVGAFLTRSGTVSGVSGAVLAGISAPAILAQLGQVRLTSNLVTADHGKQSDPIILTAGARDGADPVANDEPEGASHGS